MFSKCIADECVSVPSVGPVTESCFLLAFTWCSWSANKQIQFVLVNSTRLTLWTHRHSTPMSMFWKCIADECVSAPSVGPVMESCFLVARTCCSWSTNKQIQFLFVNSTRLALWTYRHSTPMRMFWKCIYDECVSVPSVGPVTESCLW